MKKKIMLSLLVVLMLVVASLPLLAADAPVVYIDSTGVPADMEAGAEFTVYLKIKNNPGLSAIEMTFTYPESFELTAIEKTGAEVAFGGFTANTTSSKLVVDAESNVTDNGIIATLKFKVKDGVKTGNQTIGVTVNSACDFDLKSYFESAETGTTESATVSTKCAHVLEDNYTTTSEEHYKLCTKCGDHIGTEAHTFTYDNTDATKHTFTCSTCAYTGTAAHTYTYADKDDTSHNATCSVCEGVNPIEHHYAAEGTVKQEATCVAKGWTTYTCTDCDHKHDVEDIAQKAHVFGEWTKVDENNHKRTCTTCPAGVTPAEETAAHNWNAGVITTPATHTETGVKTYTCTTCAATKTETVAVNPEHNWGAWTFADDSKHTRTCSVGHETETEDHKWNAGKVTKVATCKEEGVKHHKCTVCGFEKDFTIEKLPEHTWEDWKVKDMKYHTRTCKVCGMVEEGEHNQGKRVKKNATCTEDGGYTYYCSDCGAKTGSIKIRAKGHVFTDWVLDSEATATSDSVYKRTCRVCGVTETSTVKCEHTETKTETKEATCTEDGYVRKVCTSCGFIVESEEVKATGHKAGEWEVSKAATETEKGLRVKKCTVCGEVLESEEIPMIEKETTASTTTEATTTSATTAEPEPEKKSNTALIVILSVVGVAAIGTVAALLIKKKKA